MNTRFSQDPHRQGQKLGENEKGMCGPPEVNTTKRLGRAGHCALPVYIMDETLITCWKPMAVETSWRNLVAVVRRTLESVVERISSRRESKACEISGFKEASVLDLNSTSFPGPFFPVERPWERGWTLTLCRNAALRPRRGRSECMTVNSRLADTPLLTDDRNF